MSSLCSLLDDWENCSAPHPAHRPIPVKPTVAAQESIARTVVPPQRKHDIVVRKQETETPTPGKVECCEAIRHECELLRKRVDTDRQFVLALTSALIILFVMQITAQVRIDNMFSRRV